MHIADLNESAIDRHLRAIAGVLREAVDNYDGDVEMKRLVLSAVVKGLDEGDDDDLFGTEGWRYLAGLD